MHVRDPADQITKSSLGGHTRARCRRPVGRQHRSQPAVASSAFEASTRVWDLSSNHLVAGASRPDDHLVNLVVVHQDLKVDLGTRVLRAPRTSV